jgi:PKD repeat protein
MLEQPRRHPFVSPERKTSVKFPGLRYVKMLALTFLCFSLLCTVPLEAFFPALHLAVLGSEETRVAVEPSLIGANPGQYFTINVTVSDVTDLYSWGFKLKWSLGLLEVDAENITEGPFLKQGGTTALVRKNYTNYIDVGCTLLGSILGVNGSGTLASVTFKVLETGSATLDLYDVSLIDSTGVQVIGDWKYKDSPDDGYFSTTLPVARFTYTPHPAQYPWRPIVNETITFNATESYDPNDPYESTPGGIASYKWDFGDGNITTTTNPIITHRYIKPGDYKVTLDVTDGEGETNVEEQALLIQLHDINVTSVTVAPTEVSVGSTVTVKVTVLNEGNVPEHFNVTAYYNHNPIKTEARKGLQKGKTITITFSWDTTGVAEGDYQIWAEATDVEGEGDLQDNVKMDGTVTVASAEQTFPTTMVVGGVVAVIVLAIVLFSVYTRKKRNTPKENLATL